MELPMVNDAAKFVGDIIELHSIVFVMQLMIQTHLSAHSRVDMANWMQTLLTTQMQKKDIVQLAK